jgi:hypothetical protein
MTAASDKVKPPLRKGEMAVENTVLQLVRACAGGATTRSQNQWSSK